MKKSVFVFLIVLFGAVPNIIFTQNRPPLTTENKKINPRATPTPSPIVTVDNSEFDSVEEDEVIKVETNLVTVPVKVFDRNGRFIAGLKKEDFRVFEDHTEQQIAYFTNVEEPFTVVLMLDMSYSTVFKTSEIQSAANGFTAQLRPKDKVMVVSFDQEVHLLCEPTTDRQRVWQAIRQTTIGTGTSLYEAVDFVIKKLNNIKGRKAVVLFTDGVDTQSETADIDKNIRDAEELDAIIYPIQYDTFNDVQNTARFPAKLPLPGATPSSTQIPPNLGGRFPNPFPNIKTQRTPTPTSTIPGAGTSSQEYQTANMYLAQMAQVTGGRILSVTDKMSMALAFSNIADELRQTYSLGFYPDELKKEKKRKLKVKVNLKGVSVKSKDSYQVREKSAPKT